MAKVAFVGLGVMGYPMAGHLKAKGGHEVTVYNRTAAKAEKWVGQYGGKSAPTPKQAAEGQDFVMACVGNDNDLREVMLGKDGVSPASPRARSSSTTPPPPPRSPASFMPRRTSAASISSMRRFRAARPAPRTACSP